MLQSTVQPSSLPCCSHTFLLEHTVHHSPLLKSCCNETTFVQGKVLKAPSLLVFSILFFSEIRNWIQSFHSANSEVFLWSKDAWTGSRELVFHWAVWLFMSSLSLSGRLLSVYSNSTIQHNKQHLHVLSHSAQWESYPLHVCCCMPARSQSFKCCSLKVSKPVNQCLSKTVDILILFAHAHFLHSKVSYSSLSPHHLITWWGGGNRFHLLCRFKSSSCNRKWNCILATVQRESCSAAAQVGWQWGKKIRHLAHPWLWMAKAVCSQWHLLHF